MMRVIFRILPVPRRKGDVEEGSNLFGTSRLEKKEAMPRVVNGGLS